MDKMGDCGSLDTSSILVGRTIMEECLEWFIGQLSKSLEGVSPTGVQIPPPPQKFEVRNFKYL